MRMRRGAAPIALAIVLTILAAASILGAGCSRKVHLPTGPSPEVTGLAAVPSTADVVVGLDTGRLAESPLVSARSRCCSRASRIWPRGGRRCSESCKLELGQVGHLMIALGPSPPGGRIGTGR